jgi:hypothetical protein
MCYVCIAYFSHWSFLISPLLFCSIQIHRMNKHFRLWLHILCCSFKFAFTDLFPDVSYSYYSIFSFMCNILWIVVCPFVFLSFCPFLLAIALSVLRFTNSDYLFGIFKLVSATRRLQKKNMNQTVPQWYSSIKDK